MENTSLSLVLPSSEGSPSLKGALHSLADAESACARLANERMRIWLELHALAERPTFGRALLRLTQNKPALAPRERIRRAALEALAGADLIEWQRLDARFHEVTGFLLAARAHVEDLSVDTEALR